VHFDGDVLRRGAQETRCPGTQRFGKRAQREAPIGLRGKDTEASQGTQQPIE